MTLWTLTLYRQAALVIGKRHISEPIKKVNFYYPLVASIPIKMIVAGAGYHPQTLLSTYTIDKSLPSRLQAELLEMYYRVATLWQDWNQQYYLNYY